MRKWQLVTAATVGIMASGSGFIQANAAIFNYSVDFSTKEVADFSDFTQTFNGSTSNLTLGLTFYFAGSYKYDVCPVAIVQDMSYQVSYRINGSGTQFFLPEIELPNFICNTTFTTYFAQVNYDLPSNILDLVVNDDASFIEFFGMMNFKYNSDFFGKVLTLAGYRHYFEITYNFGTTYLFNYFLTDQKYQGLQAGGWTLSGTRKNYLQYVFTTAGNDEYYILNSDVSDISTTRKKYAVNYDEVYFRGESVGAQFTTDVFGADTLTITQNRNLNTIYRWYYLNVSNLEQTLVDVPEFNFEYEDCGSFLALNVGCFINNGLAYITNDAPIISDAITLLNAGMQMAGQAFGVIGAFTEDNVFGFLILGGLGITAVRWFLKND